jgi:Ni,Fe-hydrogenase III large subunit/Ni,Fe-hydrogenase III component G
MTLKVDLETLFGYPLATVDGLNGELYVPLNQEALQNAIQKLAAAHFELVSLFCAENFKVSGFTLFYVFEKVDYHEVLVLQCALGKNPAVSIAKTYPSACWYEREVTDGFGVTFDGAFDTRRLFLHETYPANFHPLLKAFKNAPISTQLPTAENEYPFKQVRGEGVYQIPVGPVHAGIIEPGHFRFSVIGETVFNLEVRLFYKHRGLEKLAEGKTPVEAVKLAEAISGDETAANTVAYCTAVEKLCHVTVPDRAVQLRTVLLELERIYSHLSDLAGMCIDVAYPVGASPFFILREEILRQNSALTGSRFLKGILTVGGLTRDIPQTALQTLSVYLSSFLKKLSQAAAIGHTYFSVIDRWETTGVVKKELLAPLHITGPVARASGKPVDTRIDHPYGAYPQLCLKVQTALAGDVYARFCLKTAEIADSIRLIQQVLANLASGDVSVACLIQDGYALALIEAPRGQSMHWVCIKNGVLDRYKIRTASFCNWQAIEHAVPGNIVPDFPLINKSMNLSYAGTDL